MPITVRQLEAVVRIAESLAKMELSSEATVDHVAEAILLFKVSTLHAANAGVVGEGMMSRDVMMEVQSVEELLKRRLAIGSSMPVTPRVGIAVATAIMMKTVTSSARLSAQLRRMTPSAICKVSNRTKSRKKAAGVQELRPRRVP